MPDLKDVLVFTQSDEFRMLLAENRPLRLDFRTVEGTEKRLDALVALGYGKSRSQAMHLCVQIGLMAFEGRMDLEEEQPAPKGDMGPVYPPGSKGDVGVGPPGELDEDFSPDDD